MHRNKFVQKKKRKTCTHTMTQYKKGVSVFILFPFPFFIFIFILFSSFARKTYPPKITEKSDRSKVSTRQSIFFCDGAVVARRRSLLQLPCAWGHCFLSSSWCGFLFSRFGCATVVDAGQTKGLLRQSAKISPCDPQLLS